MPPPLSFSAASFASFLGLIAIEWSSTLSAGSLVLGIALAISTLIGIIYGVKWKVAYEIEKRTREAAEAFGEIKSMESKDLQNRLLEAKTELQENARVIEKLEALPNLERIIHYMGENSVRLDAAASRRLGEGLEVIRATFADVMLEHDDKAEKRTDRIIEAILVSREGRAA